MGDFSKRALATAVMMPLALAAIWVSPFAFALLCWAGAAVVFSEWAGLTGQSGRGMLNGVAAILLGLCAIMILQGQPGWALGLLLGGSAALLMLPLQRGAAPWRAAGLFYAGAPLLAMLLLRLDPLHGAAAILWLMLVVWSTDICAYFAGRGFGGPKLWPAVSPKKTWAGVAGGTLGAIVAGGLTARVLGEPIAGLALFSAATALVAQAGDLAESALKRHFKAKDAGSLIPGHGGLMDRVDGLAVASVFVILVAIARADLQAPAAGILFW